MPKRLKSVVQGDAVLGPRAGHGRQKPAGRGGLHQGPVSQGGPSHSQVGNLFSHKKMGNFVVQQGLIQT
jgi:hypothetical protein